MLIPIIKYANSDYNAVVSLFGEMTTEDTYDIVYHPAFENTLLGMRLLQADIIFFDLGETWQLPKLDGQTVLGAGEKVSAGEDTPKYRVSSAGCSHLQVIEAAAPPENPKFDVAAKLDEILAQKPFQSWVMTDQETPVIVELQEGHLPLRGSPYYFFWKSDFDKYKRELDRLKREGATARAKSNALLHNQIVERANDLEPRVIEVESIARDLRQKRQLLHDFNPTVYTAATTVVQYSALFRLIKLENRENWEEFLSNTQGVQTTPSVQTPTRWVKLVSPRHDQRVQMNTLVQTSNQSPHAS